MGDGTEPKHPAHKGCQILNPIFRPKGKTMTQEGFAKPLSYLPWIGVAWLCLTLHQPLTHPRVRVGVWDAEVWVRLGVA